MRTLPASYLITVMLFVLTGCAATPPSHFYVLGPVAGDAAVVPADTAPAIGVGPVTLPDYLDRPQIAVRNGAFELRYDETHRWAENLPDNVTSVLAENLARLVPTGQVARFPWGRTTRVDFQLVADISRFDAEATGTVVLSVRWKLYRGEDRQLIAEQASVFNETFRDDNYTEIVAAQSRALEAFSREVAVAIRGAASRQGVSP
jgi:uncharacterized lipoprotein YmbA